ncbi:hypothetical protein MHYP_G00345590 [Metynnis hypsauchen]
MMEYVYGNVDYELSKTSGNERCRISAGVSGHAVQSVRQRNPLSSKDSLKFLLAALGLLLLCALVALCVLGILYHNKGVSYEALSEQYSSAVERLSVQERRAGETERKFDALKVKYRTTHEALANCSECQNCALCGEEWRSFGLKCYNFSTDKLNWTMSRDDCSEKGGHLVIITSQAEQHFLSSHTRETHWIGLNDLETEGKWMWVNNQTLNETGVTFWYKRTDGPHEPDNWREEDESGENCAALGNESGDTDVWFDASCLKKKKYICENSITFTVLGTSLSGSVVCSEADMMEHVYGNVDYDLSKTSGNERHRISTDVSGQSIREWNPLSSKDSLKFLLAALGLLLLCALVALCVLGILYHNKGVSYEALSEQYSSAVERLSAQERSTAELQSRLAEVQLNYQNAVKRLDSPKETERKFDALKVKYRTTHEALANCSECQKCALCGEGWRPFGLKCYYFSTDKLNWTMSRDYCAQKGGHLVIITSQAEQDFVSSRVGEHHWIGLNDLETEGKWVWVNNQTMTETGVTFWFKRTNHQDEPDNWTQMDPSGENCASLGDENGNTNKWFDAYCRKLKKYICEK